MRRTNGHSEHRNTWTSTSSERTYSSAGKRPGNSRPNSATGGTSAMARDAAAAIQPYLGPRPFELNDRHLFFGREREAHELSSLILANRITVLYAASGAGKTSLINAGIRPLIEDELEVLPTARFHAGASHRLS